MSESLYLLTIGLVLGTIVLIFAMRYFSTLQQARARLANDEAFRRLSETAIAAESGAATTLAAMQATLADIGTRLASVEKMLKAIE